jgi:hypothetical protein
MTEHRYPPRALAADYGRAVLGIMVTATPLALVEAGRTVTAVLVALTVTFVLYAVRTACRGATRVWVDDEGIATRGVRRTRLSWRDITGMRLHYYSTKRDGRAGWMQLRLSGPAGAMRIESSLDGFVDIVRRAYAAARSRGIALNPATAANLRLLGVRVPEAP